MSGTPVVSICVANFQGAAVIEACLDSLLSQESDVSVEIIVFDDASPDESAQIVSRRYPAVHLIKAQENVGYCRANRIMVEQARGEFILLFNNDAWLLPGSLQALVSAARGIEGAAILGLPQFNAATGVLEDRGRLLDPFFNAVPNFETSNGDVAMVAGACLWLPRALWLELGGFPEWFESTGEDLYLCCAARLRGYPVRVLGSGGFHHWIGHSIGGGKVINGRLSSTTGRRFRSERNKMAVVLACFPAILSVPWVVLIALQLLCEGGALSLLRAEWKIFSEIYLRAILDLWGKRAAIGEISLRPKPAFRNCLAFCIGMTWAPYKLTLLLRHGLPEIRRR